MPTEEDKGACGVASGRSEEPWDDEDDCEPSLVGEPSLGFMIGVIAVLIFVVWLFW